VKKATGFYPRPDVNAAGTQVVSQTGAVLLTETIAAVGLDVTLPAAMPGTNSSHTPRCRARS
jgi:hypothetical protein